MTDHLIESQMGIAHNAVLGLSVKRSSISQEDKGFLGRQLKPIGEMAMQKKYAKIKLFSQASVVCSYLYRYFRIRYL